MVYIYIYVYMCIHIYIYIYPQIAALIPALPDPPYPAMRPSDFNQLDMKVARTAQHERIAESHNPRIFGRIPTENVV